MLALLFAFLADILIGDPVYPYHPVRLMGKAIEWTESFLRRTIQNEKLAGTLLALSFPLTVWVLVGGIIFVLMKIHFVLGWLANCLGIYSSISIHDLRQEGMRIYRDLKEGDLLKARSNVARIVGRDTTNLSEDEVIRATIESIAENSVDGIIAPMFFAALGGAPLALAYKAVNTLDSMIGYKNEQYLRFGAFAAEQDNIVNWIPARLGYFLIGLASFFVTPRGKEAFEVGLSYAMNQSYSNSPIPEATFAGALGVRLGGQNLYQGKIVQTPYLGLSIKPFHRETVLECLRLMIATAWMTLFLCLMIHYGIAFVRR